MMTGFKPHRIRTQQVEVAFENPDDAFACKNRLADVCKSKLLPAIEKLFDQKAGQKMIICIDKLHVDAGLLDNENWENKLVEVVISELNRYLDEEVFEKNTGHKRKEEGLYDESLNDSGAWKKGEILTVEQAGREAEALLYFLQHGVLPWYATIKSKTVFQQQFTLLMADQDFKQKVRALIMADETAFERLVYHTEENIIFSIIEGDGIKRAAWKKLKKNWHRIFVRLNLSPSERNHLFFSAIYQVLVKNAEIKPEAESITLKMMDLMTKTAHEQLIALLENPGKYHFTREESRIIQWIRQHKKVWDQDNKMTDKIGKENTNTKSGKKSIKIVFDEENPVFIMNAGLVLLHPFLTGLFENVGYTTKNEWVSEALHQRSLLLTQYLITSQDEYPEFDLFLNKLLTGYPLEASLPEDIGLSAFEKGEAADLLQAVINHWKVLKSTSVQGLQNTFLQREGKIVKKESGWLLQVEQKAFDILLDKIPWGFSTIKTPWMDELMHVEWA